MGEKTRSSKVVHKRLRILRLVLSIGETNAAYNQFSLALLDEHDITICTYFRSNIIPPKEIALYEGNDTLLGFFWALKAALTEKTYDVIHAHTPHVGFLFLVARMFRPKKSLSATVYTVHSSFQNYKKFRNKLLLVPCFGFFQRVVCCSKASIESVPSFYRWLAGDRLFAVQNGVDIDRVDRTLGNNNAHYLSNSQFTVTTVGRLIEIKNPLLILNAFQQCADPDSYLVYIGEGHLRDNLIQRKEAFGLGNQVELTGLISREEVYKRLANADIVISASQVEGLPIAVLEAMACRRPVLLSDILPHREIAKGASFIPLIRPDDREGWSREIERFKQMPASRRAEIGEKCRKLVEERFGLASMHRGYEAIYHQVQN